MNTTIRLVSFGEGIFEIINPYLTGRMLYSSNDNMVLVEGEKFELNCNSPLLYDIIQALDVLVFETFVRKSN